jgi:hypothetical protein
MTEKNNNFKILHFVKAKISINSDFRNSEIINFLWQFSPDQRIFIRILRSKEFNRPADWKAVLTYYTFWIKIKEEG